MLVQRRKIDLEVAGVNDDAYGSFDGQRDAIDQRVRDADGLDGERADGELLFGSDLDQLDLVEQLVLFKLALYIGQRELSGVDGNF